MAGQAHHESSHPHQGSSLWLPAELDVLLKRMRLPYFRRAAPEVCATARAQRWDPAEVMRVLLAEEVKGRDAATHAMRRRAAGFPSGKTFEGWRPGQSSIPQPTQQALMTLEWVGRAENLAVCGPSGTGKSHFCEALGQPSSRPACASPGSPWSRSPPPSCAPSSTPRSRGW
jgi:DNA replication protein DnaC